MRQGGSAGRGALVVLAALAVLHLGLLALFVAPSLWFAGEPLPNVDFQTHANQTWRVLEGLHGWGKTWVYDVQLLAGHPTGALFDADNKAWELWAYAMTCLGLDNASAFNTFALFVHLTVVPVAYAAARLFDLDRVRAVVAVALTIALWWFDAWLHWCWWIGMVAYAAGSLYSALPLALFYRFTEDRRPWQAIACALALGLAHLVHPYAFFILVAPMLALWLRARSQLGARGHLAVIAIAAATLAINAYWLVIAARFWHYILDSSFYGQSTLAFLGADLLEWTLDPETTGQIGNRTTIRWIVIAAAAIGLGAWRGRGDRRLLPFAVALIVLASLTYLGGYSRIAAQIQPFRHVAPLALLAVYPAAEWLGGLVAERRWRSWPSSVRAPLLLLSIPAGQHLVAEATYYAHEAIPKPRPSMTRYRWMIEGSGFGKTPDYRLRASDAYGDALAAWVRDHDDGQRRFLVELGHVGEYLGWSTRAQIIGGFTHRNLQHSLANLFRRYPAGALVGEPMRVYLDTYAIGWIIVTLEAPWLAAQTDVVEEVARFGAHVVYRVRDPAPLIARGGGEVRASTNRIEVRGSDPDQELLLRYHWMETLACAPECTIERAPIDGIDPVGFVRVPAPHPADLEIVNTYEVQP